MTHEEMEKVIKFLPDLASAQASRAQWEERAVWSDRMSRLGRQYVTVAQAEADQARLRSALFDEAMAALRVLRAASDTASRQRAAEALEKALEKLGVLTKQPGSGSRR